MAHKQGSGHFGICPGTILSTLSIILYCAGFIRVELKLSGHEDQLNSLQTQHKAASAKNVPDTRARRSVADASQVNPTSPPAADADTLLKLCQSVVNECVQGPPGPRGPTGLRGPQGPPGARGEPGESISPPHVIMSPSTVTVNESVTATLMCSVTGNPKPQIEWTKDGGSLPSNKTTLTDLGELKIQKVQLDDAGRYKCSVKNILGKAEGSAHLTVQAHPSVALEFGPTYVAENSSITLPKCKAAGFPVPTIKWSKEPGHFPALHDNQEGELIIYNTRKPDSGLYACKASNVLGSVSASTLLTVVERPRFTVKPPEILNVNKGGDVSVSCRATAEFRPTVTWSKVGGVLPHGRSQVLADGTLKITGAVNKDAGKFVCTASAFGIKSQAGMQLNIAVLGWVDYTPYWCGSSNRVSIGSGKTAEECIQACGARCITVEWWERGGRACFICKDPSLKIRYTNTKDTYYPPHVFVKQ